MSTPTLAPTMLPAHHGPYGYPHAQDYTQVDARSYPANNSLPAAPRINPNYTLPHPQPYQYPQPPLPPLSPLNQPSFAPSMASSQPSRPPEKKHPNWTEFYKNGVPKEIIVIDDDSPEPDADGRNRRTQNLQAGQKRKFDQGYEVEHTDSPVYSTHHAQYGSSSSASIHSNGRTNSIQTVTAPTSLESYGSNPASHSYEDLRTGQKRKRIDPPKITNTRGAAARKAKADAPISDPFVDYIPPSKPIRKAEEVVVPVVRDTLRPKNATVDDKDGHYIVEESVPLTDRYDILRMLGQGTFGKVVEAFDKRKKTRCAIKIIRSVQKYRDASRIELRVLSTLALNDRSNQNRCIHLRDCFDFRNHICIVTDLLGQSVFDFLKGNAFVPFPSSQIQSFARQLFTSVAFLHDLNLIHTDLKPENILLVHNAYQTFTYNRNIPSSSHTTARVARQRRVLLDSEIRLIDFGSATFDDEYHSSVVSTRHYRAPEIILQLGWSFPCDIWSIGCILVEFFTGDALFQTHDNLEHLAMMEAVCNGKIEPKVIRQVIQNGRNNSSNTAYKFFVKNRLDYPNQETSKASKKYVKGMKHLHDFIPNNSVFNKQFLDLLRKIFVYDPKQRITAKQALQHAWFRESQIDDGTEAIRIRDERAEQAAREAMQPRPGDESLKRQYQQPQEQSQGPEQKRPRV